MKQNESRFVATVQYLLLVKCDERNWIESTSFLRGRRCSTLYSQVKTFLGENLVEHTIFFRVCCVNTKNCFHLNSSHLTVEVVLCINEYEKKRFFDFLSSLPRSKKGSTKSKRRSHKAISNESFL